MYKSKISSDLLFHFTKGVDILSSIIKNGFYPRTAIEDVSFMLPNYDEAKIGIPMVCFTDIPIELSDEHRAEYGKFGIGMKKEWGKKRGLSPVNYVIEGTVKNDEFNKIQKCLIKNGWNLDEESVLEMMDVIMNYAGFNKLYAENSSLDCKPFYDEREWRYLPPFKDSGVGIDGYCNRLLPNRINDEEKNKLNEHMKQKYSLQFEYDDVGIIIVPDQKSASELCHQLNNGYEQYWTKIEIKE